MVSTAYCADFTTYIGDSNQYQVAAITTDSAGNTYVTGGRVIQAQDNSSDDVFVTKLDATGNIVFTTTFGGKGNDEGSSIGVDPAGNIWVGGATRSENFPLHDAFQTAQGSGSQTGFLVELAQDGTVIYSSYFGGVLGGSGVSGVATDQSGNVYVTGTTSSSDFPTTAGLPAGMVSSGGVYPVYGAFVTKLDATGRQILYSAVVAGSAVDCSGGSNCFLMERSTGGAGIAIDGAGNALVAGNTNTTDLPVTAGGVPGDGAFAAKINAAGNELVYLTYLGPPANIISDFGPSQTINAGAIAADAAGNAYLTGSTNDPEFPATPGAYQTKLSADATNAFAVKLSPAGTELWGTYLGGPGPDAANSISLDGSGDLWLTGDNGPGFPVTSPVSVTSGYGNFLTELSADGSALLYSAEFPGGQGVAVDQNGVLHVASEAGLVSTITPGQPSTPHILDIVNAAGDSGVSGRITPGEVISIFGFGLGPATPVTATPENGFFSTLLAGVQVFVNGAAIPLLYVSASQINAEIPAPLSDMNSGQVQVINNLAALPDFRVWVDASDFGIFLNSDGSAAAINQDGTLNSSSNPAKAGSIVSVWATGFDTFSLTVDGAVATVANNWCGSCNISAGGVSETVAYAGAAPGLIDGIMQINFMVPAQLGTTTQLPLDFEGLGTVGFLWVSQ
jgi:uncharacterized protein (TIGR03437 family)